MGCMKLALSCNRQIREENTGEPRRCGGRLKATGLFQLLGPEDRKDGVHEIAIYRRCLKCQASYRHELRESIVQDERFSHAR